MKQSKVKKNLTKLAATIRKAERKGTGVSIEELIAWAERTGRSGTMGFIGRVKDGILLQMEVNVTPEERDRMMLDLRAFIESEMQRV